MDSPGEKEAERPARADFAFSSIVGRSRALRAAVDLARRVARRRTTVLLSGETGTGKDLFARAIHYAGPAAGEPFVAVNCAAIPASLLESELFGYERGAFTGAVASKRGLFELAGSGTLFLDEVEELPLDLQPKLLRVLEEHRVRRLGALDEREVACRIVAATNESLDDAVADARFREDLFYRLSVFRVELPALREREGDILLLARHFLDSGAAEHGFADTVLSPEAAAVLEVHSWPGNIRELKNVLEQALILSDGGVIAPQHLQIKDRRAISGGELGRSREITIPERGKALAEIEREAIDITLALTGGNRSAAARILRISRPTLARKIRQYGLSAANGRKPSGGDKAP